MPLAREASTTCVVTVPLTQPQIDAGNWSTNVKIAASTSQGVPASRSHAASADLGAAPKITVAKTTAVDMTKAGPADRVDAGDTATYSYVVTNKGNVTLSKVSVIDAAAGTVNCPKTTLAPKATTTCTAAVAKLTQSRSTRRRPLLRGRSPRAAESPTPSPSPTPAT